MPKVEVSVDVDVPVDVAFSVSQTTGELRLSWDPFVRHQELLDGAAQPAAGVRTRTLSRHGLVMVSQYTSFRPPTQVGMKMVDGPWFFTRFGGGWSFASRPGGGTTATWRYTFSVRPRWLAPVADRVGVWLLGRDIERRIQAFAAACTDPEVVAAAPRL